MEQIIFLKSGDIIIALNNQLYIYGEKQFTDELRELKKSKSKALLTILREDTFFEDLIVESSLGCKFSTITPEQTNEIKAKYKSKEIHDLEDVSEFVVMRDIYRKCGNFTNSSRYSQAL